MAGGNCDINVAVNSVPVVRTVNMKTFTHWTADHHLHHGRFIVLS
jgi:hypothetical protein